MEIFVSSGAFGAPDLPGTLKTAQAWGVKRVELTAGMAPIDDPLPALRAMEGSRFLIHNYFPSPRHPFVLNLASEDKETLQRSLDHCRNALRLSAELGAPYFSVHAGFAAHLKPEHLGRGIPAECAADLGRAAEIFENSIAALIPEAESSGVKLCVENNVVAPVNLIEGQNRMLLLATAEDLIAFIRKINSPWVGLLVDVGHVKVTCQSLNLDPIQFLADVAPYTEMLHLSDNNGAADTNEAFDDTAWFLAGLQNFHCSIAVIEAYYLTREKLNSCVAAIETGS